MPRRGQVRLHLPALPSLDRVLLPRPFAAPLRALHRYYAGSDSSPARTRRRGLSASFALPSEHPTPSHVVTPGHHHLIHVGVPAGSCDLDFALDLRARRLHHAETGSSSCGLLLRLRLLPTPPRGDAVAFGYMWRDLTWVGLSPPDKATSQTHRSRITSAPTWRSGPRFPGTHGDGCRTSPLASPAGAHGLDRRSSPGRAEPGPSPPLLEAQPMDECPETFALGII